MHYRVGFPQGSGCYQSTVAQSPRGSHGSVGTVTYANKPRMNTSKANATILPSCNVIRVLKLDVPSSGVPLFFNLTGRVLWSAGRWLTRFNSQQRNALYYCTIAIEIRWPCR